MLTTTKRMLENARSGGYAVGAFNVENAEMVQAVLAAAEELSAPVILQTTPGTLRYLPPAYFAAMVKAAEPKIPAALHLDHGSSLELAFDCMDCGYSSVMIDGSSLPFEENILLTSRVSTRAKEEEISVEAELGKVGGKEDDLSETESPYTDPEQAEEFVRRTGVDSLAIAFGTAHGIYQKEPKLDLNRVSLVQERVGIPIVMHGASGLPDETIRQAVQKGVAKINFATELRIAFSQGVKEYLSKDPDAYDPKKYMAEGRQKVKQLVKSKIMLCGCAGKAEF